MIEHGWLAVILFFGGLLGITPLLLAVGTVRNRWRRRQIADGRRAPLVIEALGWSPPSLVEEADGGSREVDLVQAMGAVKPRALTTAADYTLAEGEARVAATLDILKALEGESTRDAATPDIPLALEGEPSRDAGTLEIPQALEVEPDRDFTAPHPSNPADEESPRRFNPAGLRSRIAAALKERVWGSLEVGLLDLEELPRPHGQLWDPRKAS